MSRSAPILLGGLLVAASTSAAPPAEQGASGQKEAPSAPRAAEPAPPAPEARPSLPDDGGYSLPAAEDPEKKRACCSMEHEKNP